MDYWGKQTVGRGTFPGNKLSCLVPDTIRNVFYSEEREVQDTWTTGTIHYSRLLRKLLSKCNSGGLSYDIAPPPHPSPGRTILQSSLRQATSCFAACRQHEMHQLIFLILWSVRCTAFFLKQTHKTVLAAIFLSLFIAKSDLDSLQFSKEWF